MRIQFGFSRTILALLTLTTSTIFSNAQVMFRLDEDKFTTWHYTGGDEFNSSIIDTSKWQSSYPWGQNLYCNKEQQYYTDFKNVVQSSGVLTIEARRETVREKAVHYEQEDYRLVCNGEDMGRNLRDFEYTSGMIFSKQKYSHGYFEIRFKSDAGRGLWPAFWLYAGVENEEIDVFEIKGERNNQAHVDVHCPSGCKNYKTTLGLLRKNWGDFLTASAGWHQGFNVLAIDWQPGFVKWYLNGKGIAYWKGNLTNPMWVIANLAIPSDNGPFGPGPDASTTFPAKFEIDYIRIWSQKESVDFTFTLMNYDAARTTPVTNPVSLKKKSRPEFKRKHLSDPSEFIMLSRDADGMYHLNLPRKIEERFLVEVLNKKENLIYSSSDGSLLTHKIAAEPRATMRLQAGGRFVEFQLE